jgi:hypothetical protein
MPTQQPGNGMQIRQARHESSPSGGTAHRSHFGLICSFHTSKLSKCEVRVNSGVEALGYKPEGRGFQTRWSEYVSSVYLRFTQSLTEMSTRSWKIVFLGSRARPVRSVDNLTLACEPTVLTMWDPQHLTTLEASTAWYGDSFALLLYDTMNERKSVALVSERTIQTERPPLVSANFCG